ncbi:hypothetical protein [Thauera sp.]|uniref:hypothetical protein n=1 Tax=Thauera sp. TaxID=1905334 RepID=UPI002607AD6D|nr:hypothetical protein [Thauera sp.]MCK6408581.1 hypothetical protein [Thauera sp.]
MGAAQVLAKEVQQRVDADVLGADGYGPLDELRLATLAIRGYDHAARDPVGDGAAVVLTDEVKAAI